MSSDRGLSRQQVAKALRYFIIVFGLWTFHDACILPGLPILAGYALKVGLTESQIAFLAGLLGLTGLWALGGARLMRGVRNKRRTCVVVGSIAILATPALIGVGLWIPPQYRFAAVCALMGWLFLLGWSITPELGNWQANVIPAQVRGTFLGRRLFIPAVVSMIYLFLAGRWLDGFPESDLRGFYTLFVVALVAGAAGYAVLGRTPYPLTHDEPDARAGGSWLQPLRDMAFRRLALCYASAAIPAQMAGAFFSVYMINHLHLTYTHIAVYVNVAYAFMLVGYLLGGNFSQRFGSRPVIQIFSVLYWLAPVAWALSTPTTYSVLIPLAYTIGGLSLAALYVATNALLYKIVPEGRDNSHYFGLWTAMWATGASIGPFLGALLKSVLPEAPVNFLGLEMGPIQIIFALAAVLWVIPLVISWRLVEEGAARPGYVLGQFRGSLLGLAWNTALYAMAAGERTRAAAIHRLGETHSPLAVSRLVKALDDVSPEVRSEAARGLGEARAEEAVPSLVSHLEDEESDIRAEAAHALGKIGSGAGIEALVAALHESEPHVRSAAALALGEINNEAAQVALLAALHDEFDRATFPALIDAASRSGDLALLPLTLGYLPRFRSPVLRMQVINAVCRLVREKGHFYRLFSADEYQRAQMMDEMAQRIRRLFARAGVLDQEARGQVIGAAQVVREAIEADDWPLLGEQAQVIAGTVGELSEIHPVAAAAAEAIKTYLVQVPPADLSDEGAIFCMIGLVSMARMLCGDTRG